MTSGSGAIISGATEQGWSDVWARLIARFPSVEPQGVLTVLLDARHAVELFGKDGVDRFTNAERIAATQLTALVAQVV